MFPKLQFDERWLADYENFQKAISEISDFNLQRELTDVLTKLKAEVEYIDSSHEQLFMTGKIPTEVTELRSNIATYRKILEEGISAYKTSIRPH